MDCFGNLQNLWRLSDEIFTVNSKILSHQFYGQGFVQHTVSTHFMDANSSVEFILPENCKVALGEMG